MTNDVTIVASLLVAGYLLLAMEAFIVPGFGVAGIGGFLSLGLGCWLAFSWLGPIYGSVAVVVVVATTTVLMIWYPRSRYGRGVVQDKTLADAFAGNSDLTIGQIGEAESDLRPAGVVRFEEQRESVVTGGEYIPSGTPVSVIEVRGSIIVVESAQKNN